MIDKEYFTVFEAADLLKVHWQTIHNLIKRGELKASKIGRSYRIASSDLDTFINKNTNDLKEEPE